MKKIMRVITLLSLCVLLLFTLSANTQAATVEDLTYEIYQEEVFITGCSTDAYGALIIPDTIEGLPVRGINNEAFKGCSNLTSIIIPDGIRTIGNSAFLGCSKLTEITIPDSVTSIGSAIFSGCSKLTSITVPFIGDSVKIPSNTYQYPLGYFFGRDSYTGSTEIKQYYYNYSTTNTDYSYYCIPSSLRMVTVTGGNILNGAFYNCTMLTKIVLGDNVGSIEDNAFYNCTNLSAVTVGNSVTSIGNYAFYKCKVLTGVTIPDSVLSIGDYAFSDCEALAKVVIGSGVSSIGSYAFDGCSAMTTFTVGDGLKNIGERAFNNCYSLRNIALPKRVVNIGAHAFTGCDGLMEITVDENNPMYCSDAMGVLYTKEKTELIKAPASGLVGAYHIPESVTQISANAFDACVDLTSVTIPEGVTAIGSYAFADCGRLTNVTIPDSVTSIGSAVFSGCSQLTSITVPFIGGSVKIPSNTYQYPLGYFFGRDSYTGSVGIYQYYYGDSTTNTDYSYYCIPSSLRMVTVTGGNILNGAFYNCTMLTKVVLGDNVGSIEEYAFYNCNNIYSISMGCGVATIGNYAFSGCVGLDHVYYQGVKEQWEDITIGSNNAHLLNAKWHWKPALQWESEDKLIVLADGSLGELLIEVDQVLDLNGQILSVDYLASFGQIIDSAGGGGLVVNNLEMSSNEWLPVYDTNAKCYRFFAYNLSKTQVKETENGAVFGFSVDFVNESAYSMLMQTADPHMNITITLSCEGYTKTFAFSRDMLRRYAKLEMMYPNMEPMMMLTVTGIDTLSDGAVLTVTPSVTAIDGKINEIGDCTEYIA